MNITKLIIFFIIQNIILSSNFIIIFDFNSYLVILLIFLLYHISKHLYPTIYPLIQNILLKKLNKTLKQPSTPTSLSTPASHNLHKRDDPSSIAEQVDLARAGRGLTPKSAAPITPIRPHTRGHGHSTRRIGHSRRGVRQVKSMKRLSVSHIRVFCGRLFVCCWFFFSSFLNSVRSVRIREKLDFHRGPFRCSFFFECRSQGFKMSAVRI